MPQAAFGTGPMNDERKGTPRRPIPRLTFLEFMLILGIVGLFCVTPIQCRWAQDRAVCRYLAKWHADRVAEMTIMAGYPAAWMDEFRPELRRKATWSRSQSRRLERSNVYDPNEEERIARAEMDVQKARRFWARLKAVAAQHGYQMPRVGGESQVGLFTFSGWPILASAVFLILTFRIVYRSRVRRSQEGDNPV